MPPNTAGHRFLAATQESYQYNFSSQSPASAQERAASSIYYDKNVDVLISRDRHDLDIINVKFVISNYWQNSINYFEQQIGETANLRRRNITYGNLFCATNPIPYKKRSDGNCKNATLLTGSPPLPPAH